MATACEMILNAIKLYWKAWFTILYPLILLPVFLFKNEPAFRCLYVVMIMAGFWIVEPLPLAVTSMIPIVFFPLMGILDSDKVAMAYLKETNMMFIGGLIVAIAIEHCKLHTRISLHVIKKVGCSPKKLNVGLVTVTMLVSMWISNTAAAAMMIPIIDATLKELEGQGIGQMFETPSLEDPPPAKVPAASLPSIANITKGTQPPAEETRKPTRQTMCYFISTAYAASIGGNGCLLGSGTNLTFKDSPGVEFVKWLFLNVPMMLVMMYGTVIWLQFWYLGLFRPNSEDAKRIQLGAQGEEIAKNLISTKLDEMGPMTFHEKGVAFSFILVVLLWFFRRPQFIPGWAEMITDYKVKDACAAFIVVLMMFIIPSNPNFIYMFSKDDEKRPKIASQALLNWKVVQQKIPWGLVFLLGGGFALADASKESGMSKLIADYLADFATLPPFAVMAICSLFATIITQFTSTNVAIANIVLPVIAEMAVAGEIHPMYLMMPATLGCSFSYCLPVSTPPLAIAAAPCNMTSIEMAKAGLGVAIVSLITLYSIFPFLAPLIWDFEEFPEWAAT